MKPRPTKRSEPSRPVPAGIIQLAELLADRTALRLAAAETSREIPQKPEAS